jgi:hypothetical protein
MMEMLDAEDQSGDLSFVVTNRVPPPKPYPETLQLNPYTADLDLSYESGAGDSAYEPSAKDQDDNLDHEPPQYSTDTFSEPHEYERSVAEPTSPATDLEIED